MSHESVPQRTARIQARVAESLATEHAAREAALRPVVRAFLSEGLQGVIDHCAKQGLSDRLRAQCWGFAMTAHHGPVRRDSAALRTLPHVLAARQQASVNLMSFLGLQND